MHRMCKVAFVIARAPVASLLLLLVLDSVDGDDVGDDVGDGVNGGNDRRGDDDGEDDNKVQSFASLHTQDKDSRLHCNLQNSSPIRSTTNCQAFICSVNIDQVKIERSGERCSGRKANSPANSQAKDGVKIPGILESD